MDAEFWHDIWAKDDLGFHESAANTFLQAHFGALDLAAGARVFVPLCGKTRDIAWLLSKGCHVIGAELSQTAIDQLFEDLQITPDITTMGALHHYQAPMIDIFVGDVFDVTAAHVGTVDAVYDRAALVALPADMRTQYSAHVMAITARAQQLVICFSYDQAVMDGPPFSIDEGIMKQLFAADYRLTKLDERDAAVRATPAKERAWHLTSVG